MNPYEDFIRQWTALLEQGRSLPLGRWQPPAHPPVKPDAPKALIFSPHPDDEVIIGGLPLRLKRERGWNVLNVAVTQGSNQARQTERWRELVACCQYIGFGLIPTGPNGLEGINPKTRAERPAQWAAAVQRIAEILIEQRPAAIFFPHDADWNSTHIGTHWLLIDALTRLGPDFSCLAFETEFWGAMTRPNLMVETSTEDLIALVTALTFHEGEVRRNPYHLRMAAWMIDNVRRGAELVGGQGLGIPDYLYATLYRLRRWHAGKLQDVWTSGRFLGRTQDPNSLMIGTGA